MKYILNNTKEAVSGTEFKRGHVIVLDLERDELTALVDETIYEAIPVFYKCASDFELLSNGAVKGSASAFAVGDEVTLCFIKGVPIVVGFTGGAKPCSRHRLAYPAENGYYIAPHGEILPSEFVSTDDFEKDYILVEPLEEVGDYFIQTTEGEVDECLSFKDHTLMFGLQELVQGRENTDKCNIDRWGRWFQILSQCRNDDLTLSFYEIVETVITGGNEWTVDRYFRLAYANEFIQIAHQLEDWKRSPTYYGTKIRKVNQSFLGKTEAGFYLAVSCVVGSQEADTELRAFVLTQDALREEVFPISGGVVDLGLGSAYPSMVMVKKK
jgi:hypothetical protein